VARIRKAVIEAKIALSSQPTAKLDVDLPGGRKYRREISLEGFGQMIQPIIDRTIGPCKQALKDAGLKPEQIDEVVLVGGSTAFQGATPGAGSIQSRAAHGSES